MLEKVIPVGSWDFQMEPTSVIKMASSGLRGDDRDALFVKRAASHVFAEVLDRIKLGSGDIPIHAIAIGATERYGANRNGDGFSLDTCRKRASTFVGRPLSQYKQGEHNGARLYYNHANKNPEKSYGYAKAAAFNEEMGRIELLMIANGTKEAAERNGGLVMPADDLEKLANDGLLPWSMAVRVPYDVCAVCHNKAASPRDYCTADSCVGPDGFRGLGCKHGLTKLAANGRQQYVENPNGLFFDFSRVYRPADRTAYGGRAVYFDKAASADDAIGGAALANLYSHFNYNEPTASLHDDLIEQRVQLLHKLASYEQAVRTENSLRAFSPAMQPELDWTPLSGSFLKTADGLRALADAQALLTPADFLTVCGGQTDREKIAAGAEAIAARLPGVYGRIAEDSSARQQLQTCGYDLTSDAFPSAAARSFAEKTAASRSGRPQAVQDRVMRSTLRQHEVPTARQACLIKTASDDAGEQLAREYAVTKLAMLLRSRGRCSDADFDLLCRYAVLQNHV